jgi:hypothetical protein
MALGNNPLCKTLVVLKYLEQKSTSEHDFARFQLHHFESAREDQYSDKATTTCSTGLMFYILDSFFEQ